MTLRLIACVALAASSAAPAGPQATGLWWRSFAAVNVLESTRGRTTATGVLIQPVEIRSEVKFKHDRNGQRSRPERPNAL